VNRRSLILQERVGTPGKSKRPRLGLVGVEIDWERDDTNCVSELVRPKPESRVMDWMEAVGETMLYLGVLSLGLQYRFARKNRAD
jgi:hypothetical protein